MDATSIQTLVESVSVLKLALEETKKQYGAVDRLRSDWEERWKQGPEQGWHDRARDETFLSFECHLLGSLPGCRAAEISGLVL